MEIKSTMIKNRSTDGGNHSSTGSDESIRHMGDQEEHFGRTSVGGVPSVAVGKGRQEFPLEPNVPGIPGGNGCTGFRASDAAHEPVNKC